MSRRRAVALGPRLLGELVFATLVLGTVWGPIVTGVVAAVCLRLGVRTAGRASAAIAAGLVALAGAATVLEAPVGDWNLRFASSRPVASGAAAAGATFAMASVVLVLTPPTGPRPVVAARRSSRRSSIRALRSRVSLRPATAILGSAIAVAALRILLGPDGMEPALEQTAANVRDGIAYAAGLAPGTSVAPLTPVLLLVSGLGERTLAVAAAIGGVASAGLLWRDPQAARAVTACLVAAVLPSIWAQPLPVALAGALVGGAVVLVRRAGGAQPPTAAVGVLLGLALLADPTTVVAAGAIGVWVWTDPEVRRGVDTSWRVAASAYLAFAVVAVAASRSTGATLASWWGSGGAVGDPGRIWLLVDGLAGAAMLAAAWRRRFPLVLAGLPCIVLVIDLVTRAGTTAWGWSAPLVAAGAVAWFGEHRAAAGQATAQVDTTA